jgi:hypothetical protein
MTLAASEDDPLVFGRLLGAGLPSTRLLTRRLQTVLTACLGSGRGWLPSTWISWASGMIATSRSGHGRTLIPAATREHACENCRWQCEILHLWQHKGSDLHS